jgi:hypothetical protein
VEARLSRDPKHSDQGGVQTAFRAGVGARLPPGLELRKQGGALTDAVAAGQEIAIGDADLDARFVIHGFDQEGIARLLQSPDVRQSLLGLATLDGDLRVDEVSVRVVVARYVTAEAEIQVVLDHMAAAVQAMRVVAPPLSRTPTPAEMPVRRPTLSGLLRRAASAGASSTTTGRDSLRELYGQLCTLELDVERVAPYVSRLGVAEGVSVIGVVFGGTSRVEVHFSGEEAVERAKRAKLGDHLAIEGFIERYDVLRDTAELKTTVPPFGMGGHTQDEPAAAPVWATPTPATPRGRSRKSNVAYPATQFSQLAGLAASMDSLALMVDALYTGQEARNRLLIDVRNKPWTLSLRLVQVQRTVAWRVDGELRDGRTVLGTPEGSVRTVEVRFPPARNAEIDGAEKGAILDGEVLLVAWDDFSDRPVLEARPTSNIAN